MDIPDRPTVFQVFTPGTQAQLNFVPRPRVNNQLVDALRTPGRQIIVYGESGSGKTTLVQAKLRELYPNHITTYCTSLHTYESIVLDAFDKLAEYYVSERTVGTQSSIGGGIEATYLGIKGSIDAERQDDMSVTSKRIVPPQLTTERLGRFMGAKGLCWVLEDFHKVPEAEKVAVAQAFKTFHDLSADFRDLRLIAVGATDTAREVVQYDRNMRGRVAEFLVPLMSDDELGEIIIGGQMLLNIDMTALREYFVKYSMGVASVCHQLALNACLNEGINEKLPNRFKFGLEHLEPALQRWVEENADTLKATFDLALRRDRIRRYDNAKIILTALARAPLDGLMGGELIREIRRVEPSYPAGNLKPYLHELMQEERGSVLLLGPDGRYRFVDPLHHSYAQISLVGVARRRRNDVDVIALTADLLRLLAEWKRPSTP